MEIEQAIKVIRALANGVHPESGAALEEGSICRTPDAIKALNRALAALVAQEEREKKRPKNAGKSWSHEEDAQICDELPRNRFQPDRTDAQSKFGGNSRAPGKARENHVAEVGPVVSTQGGLVNAHTPQRLGRSLLLLTRRCSVLLLLCTFLNSKAFPQLTAGAGSQSHRAQRARAEAWFLHGRTMPGESAAKLQQQAHEQKMQMRAARQLTLGSQQLSGSGWSSLGPAPLASDASGIGQQDYNWVSGRATAVTIDPADATANTVYAGGAYGGVWKSTNAAASNPASVAWTPLIDNQATLAVGAIAIQPQLSNPNPANSVILVGTGEANSSADSYYGLGILQSVNAGGPWTLISADTTGTYSFAGLAFSKIAFSTNATNLVVAAAAGASEGILEGLASAGNANLGLYYSQNAGTSWSYTNVQDGNVTTSPDSATSVIFNAVAGQFFAAIRYHGFYSSSDGINWTRLTNQPGAGLTTFACPAQSSGTSCPIYRGEIAVVPGRNEMYVWYVDVNDDDQGIWQSTNGGASWTQINDSGISNCGDALGCGTEDGTYNLELAAVPDGGATDLYAGAINLYKCQITVAAPTCNGTGSNTFLNLTHAYGCSSIAEVHPAQHSLSFLLLNNNTQDTMYFANDGGIYRALDGYSGLTTGTCGGSNQFDSLNQTLGSMTQFISFSEASEDANTILGGAQGNGSPATQSVLASTSWLNVNAGDGGYTAVNPTNENDWFVSTPPDTVSGVNIFRCESGISCHTQDFQDDQVVSSATLGGDTGAYYLPYILDPQNSSELIVGTCRMWRGASSGTGFSQLSNDFENGGAGICTGSETNLVRSLAAGGPLDGNGLSNVIYAGTDGFGPLIPTIPTGGHVWVSTNADGGTSTWIDQTGSINPSAFPISGIALDSSDPTGLTAYVTIMGFHVSHVWKTTNGGASWTDFTGNLPDAPADAVLVNAGTSPLTGTVYVGTDVGVFSSFTAAANWTEVGPPPSSGESGYLPNVPVTALRIFNDGTDEWLRASTYGRGIWQFPLITTPDFLISISNTPLTVFAGSQGVFQGLVFALDGYANSVNLNCIAGATAPPSTCTVSPNGVTPSSSGTPFTITTSGSDGTYSFEAQGIGTDPDSITHDATLTFNVIDFNLSPPSGNITMGPSATSSPVTFQVTAAGPFSGTVNLSCSGLPAGASCNFQPSNSATPSTGNPVSVTLTITTAINTPAGTSQIVISGSVVNGPTKTQTFSLTVIPGYSIAIANPSLTAYENSTATFNGTLTTLNGYDSEVNLSCGTGAPPTCTVAPAKITPSANGMAFTVTVSSNQCGQYAFNVVAQGTDTYAVSHSAPVTFSSTSFAPPDYTLDITNPSLSAVVNASATFNGTLTSTACYTSAVNLSCGSGAPPTCTPSPSILAPGVNGTPFTVTVSSNQVQGYNFSIVGQGTDPLAIQHVFVVSFTSTATSAFTFSLTNVSGPESINAGETATYQLSLTPSYGTFPSNVGLSFTGCPPVSNCALSQTLVAAGKSGTTITLTVQTTAAVVARSQTWKRLYAVWLPGLLFTICGGVANRKRRSAAIVLSVIAVIVALILLIACGGGLQGGSTAAANPGTPAGGYNLTVTAAMNSAPGSPTKTASVTLTVN